MPEELEHFEDPNLKEKWFEHWLQGARNGVQKTPKVNLYSINGEHWDRAFFPLRGTPWSVSRTSSSWTPC